MKHTYGEVFYMNDLYDTNILSNLSSAEGLIYGAYLRYSNGGKDDCWPSQETLSIRLGLTTRTVGRAVKRLKELHYLIQQSSGKGQSSSKASRYTVKTPAQLGFTVQTSSSSASPASVLSAAPTVLAKESTVAPAACSLSSEHRARAVAIHKEGCRKGEGFFLQYKTSDAFLKHMEKDMERWKRDPVEMLDGYQQQVDDTDPYWAEVQGVEV